MKTTRFSFLILPALFLGSCALEGTLPEVPYVPTPMEVVDRMLDLAEVKPDDVLYDLGSGDGRIVIRAATRFGAKGVGIEINPHLIRRARRMAAEEGVSHLVEFRRQDALAVDVFPATVVTLYLLPQLNARLRPALQQRLRIGARIVAHDFDIEGWTPDHVETMKGSFLHQHTLYLWKIAPPG